MLFDEGRRIGAVGEGIVLIGSSYLMREWIVGTGGDGVGPDYLGIGPVEVYGGNF